MQELEGSGVGQQEGGLCASLSVSISLSTSAAMQARESVVVRLTDWWPGTVLPENKEELSVSPESPEVVG